MNISHLFIKKALKGALERTNFNRSLSIKIVVEIREDKNTVTLAQQELTHTLKFNTGESREEYDHIITETLIQAGVKFDIYFK